MKIGFIYTKYYPLSSSASIHGYQLVKGLRERGHSILSLERDGNPDTVKFPRNPRGMLALAREADVIYIRINPYLVNDTLSLSKVLLAKGPKIVWEINAPVEEIEADYYPNIPPHIEKWVQKQNRRLRFLAKFCDGSVCVSNVLKEYAIRDLDIAHSIAVPNGSDPNLFRPLPENKLNPLHEYLKNKFVVVWAGNASFKWQGVQIIKDVANKMHQLDKNVVFLVISNKSFYDQGDVPNIISLSEINYLKLPAFLNLADAALCVYEPYTWCRYGFYGSSLKLFDYMSMGLPIIASDLGQISEILENEKDGYLTNNSVEDIVARILHLKQNPTLGKAMGDNARAKVVEHYNWDNVVGQIEQFLKGRKESSWK